MRHQREKDKRKPQFVDSSLRVAEVQADPTPLGKGFPTEDDRRRKKQRVKKKK